MSDRTLLAKETFFGVRPGESFCVMGQWYRACIDEQEDGKKNAHLLAPNAPDGMSGLEVYRFGPGVIVEIFPRKRSTSRSVS